MKTKLIVTIFAALSAFTLGSSANPIEGKYLEKATGAVYTFEKLTDHQYSISTKDWSGVAFLAPTGASLVGAFRYNDNPDHASDELKPGGRSANSVGYHQFIRSDKGFRIIYQWSLSDPHQSGAYEIERIEE